MRDDHLFTDPVHFYLIGDQKLIDSETNLAKFLTFFNTVDGVTASKSENGNITLTYGQPTVTAFGHNG